MPWKRLAQVVDLQAQFAHGQQQPRVEQRRFLPAASGGRSVRLPPREALCRAGRTRCSGPRCPAVALSTQPQGALGGSGCAGSPPRRRGRYAPGWAGWAARCRRCRRGECAGVLRPRRRGYSKSAPSLGHLLKAHGSRPRRWAEGGLPLAGGQRLLRQKQALATTMGGICVQLCRAAKRSQPLLARLALLQRMRS